MAATAQDSQIDVKITASVTELRPGMEIAASDVERSAARMQQSLDQLSSALNDHASRISAKMSQVSGDVKAANDDSAKSFDGVVEASGRAGALIGAAFVAITGTIMVAAKGAIDSMDEMNDAATRVGMTTEALSRLGYAAKMSGVEFGEVTSAMSKMSAKMQDAFSGDKNAAAWFHDVGVSVVDANGKLKAVETVVEEVADRFSKFEDGAAKTALAIDGFGRSGARLVPLLNEGSAGMRELYEESDRLGATIGGKAAEEAGKFNDEIDRLKAQVAGAARSMVSDLLPALNEIIERFRIGQQVIGDFAGGLSMAFSGGGNPREKINSLTEELNDLLDARDRYLKSGAETSSIDTAIIAIQKKIAAYKQLEIARVMAESGNNYGNEGRGKTQYDSGPETIVRTKASGASAKPKKTAETSRMPEWEAELAREKVAFMERNQMYEMSLDQEKQYWDEKLATLDNGEKEYGAVQKKSAELRLKILKQDAAESRGLSQEAIDERKRVATSEVDIQQQAAEQEYALGEISYSDMLQLDRKFEQERYEITRKAIEDRAALMAKDPNYDKVAYQKLQDQLLEADRKHAMEKKALDNATEKDNAKSMQAVANSAKQAFSGALTGMLTGTMTFRQAMSNIFNSIVGSFVQNVVTPMISDWAKGLAQQLGLYEMFFGTKTTLETASSATTTATKAAEATAVVSANAAEAASGGAASVASIPFVGWVMAAGVFASIMAMVMGAQGNIKSASGGFDIPSGVNPVTQLHEEEMVLPKEHANAIRRMSSGDEAGGVSGGGLSVHITAMDSRDVMRAMKQGGALHKVIKDFERRGVIKPA